MKHQDLLVKSLNVINFQVPREWKFVRDHPPEQVIGLPGDRVRTRSSFNLYAFVSLIDEPSNSKVEDAFKLRTNSGFKQCKM